MFEITYYSDAVRREIHALPLDLRAYYFHLVDRMEIVGPNLGMPHTRHMGDGLMEMRLKGKSGIGRVLYCCVVGGRIVMLHSFVKKTEKTPDRDLRLARKRMREVSRVDA